MAILSTEPKSSAARSGRHKQRKAQRSCRDPATRARVMGEAIAIRALPDPFPGTIYERSSKFDTASGSERLRRLECMFGHVPIRTTSTSCLLCSSVEDELKADIAVHTEQVWASTQIVVCFLCVSQAGALTLDPIRRHRAWPTASPTVSACRAIANSDQISIFSASQCIVCHLLSESPVSSCDLILRSVDGHKG